MSSGARFNLDAMRADAGAMYDVLGELVDAYDRGRIGDCVVRSSEGQAVWLIHELARELVTKHEVKS